MTLMRIIKLGSRLRLIIILNKFWKLKYIKLFKMTNIMAPHSLFGKLEYLRHRLSVKCNKVNTNTEKNR